MQNNLFWILEDRVDFVRIASKKQSAELVLGAFERLWARGFVHGDPAWRNVASTADAMGRPQVVLLDFGRAKRCSEQEMQDERCSVHHLLF
jgi:predicted unusual protein kinase regulating ubiquinone biosynthesis (AarF/ABC1/UbiB family)